MLAAFGMQPCGKRVQRDIRKTPERTDPWKMNEGMLL